MLFKTALIASQYPSLHPELRRVLVELERWSDKCGMPGITMTEALRTQAEQEELYWRAETGVPEAEARMRARRKFTHHFTGCAADLRVSEPLRALAWCEGRLHAGGWEHLVHDLGTGKHLHLAIKDDARRSAWTAEQKAATT